MPDEFRFAINPVVQEGNARRLVDMMAQFFPDGATSEDLRIRFQQVTGLRRQAYYDSLRYVRFRKWVTGSGKGVLLRLSDDASWKLPQTSAGEILERDQLEHTVSVQSQRIEELQGENGRLRDHWSNGDDANGANVALSSLLRIVSDGSASPRQRIKAASAVLGYKVHDDSAVEFVRKFLQSMCMDANIATDYKVESAELLRKFESPRIGSESVKPLYSDDSQANRAEMWRTYECWALRKQIILETHQIPPKGYDAHLQRDTYAGPPEGTAMPPVRVVEDPTSGFRLLDNLMPGFAPHRTGRGTEDAEIRTNASLALLRSRGILQVE